MPDDAFKAMADPARREILRLLLFGRGWRRLRKCETTHAHAGAGTEYRESERNRS